MPITKPKPFPIRLTPLDPDFAVPTMRIGPACSLCSLSIERLVWGVAHGHVLTLYESANAPGELLVIASELHLFGEQIADMLIRAAARKVA